MTNHKSPRRRSQYAALPILMLAFVTALGATLLASALSASEPFVTESPQGYRFAHGDARLTIEKTAWRLRLTDTHGVERFAEVRPPEFRHGDRWSAIERVVDLVRPAGEDAAQIEVVLGNGNRGKVQLRTWGEHGFVLTARCATPAEGIRGSAVLDPVEEIYGFGEMWNGRVAQRGQAFELWDHNGTPDECAYMPYYVSTRNYAFHLDYGGSVLFDVGRRRADELTYEAPTGELRLHLALGDSIAQTVQRVMEVVGLPARPPRWSFRPWFWLSNDPDHPASRGVKPLLGRHFPYMLDRLGELDIPIGVTWFEPPWQTERTSFLPSKAFHPDLKTLIGEIESRGVRALAWTVPYTTGLASNWNEAVAKGYLVKNPRSEAVDGKVRITSSGEVDDIVYTAIDFYNPEAAAWWKAQIAGSLELGLRGFKLDAGQDMPPDALVHGGRIGRDVRNAYALEYSRVYAEALRDKYGDDYLMVPRSGYFGASAYANFRWPGDLSGSFASNGLPASVYSSLSLAFCGVPFVSTDVGGYMAPPPPEDVYIRWAQFGAMLPGFQTLYMPWLYSPRAVEHFRFLAWLHTDLVPYWNSLAHEAGRTAAPVVRPLVWTFQDDVDCWRVDDQFTVGPWLLVAPILTPERYRSVYLPAGRWHDFWNPGLVHEGPKKLTWTTSREKDWTEFPLFVREGAILPLEVENEVSGFGSSASADMVTLALWPQGTGASEFVLHDREDAVPVRMEMRAGSGLQISWGATRLTHLLRVQWTGPAPREVRSGADLLPSFSGAAAFEAGRGAGWRHDPEAGLLWIRHPNAARPATVTVTSGN